MVTDAVGYGVEKGVMLNASKPKLRHPVTKRTVVYPLSGLFALLSSPRVKNEGCGNESDAKRGRSV